MPTPYGQRGGSSGSSSRSSSTSGRSIASVRYMPNGLFLALETPYNKQFLDTFRRSIVPKKRMWDENDKVWYVVRDQFEKLTHMLEEYFDETLLLEFPQQDVSTDAWSKLWLLSGAPLEVVRAVYKALSMLNHPDRGGDVEKMKDINVAYKEILGELANGDS